MAWTKITPDNVQQYLYDAQGEGFDSIFQNDYFFAYFNDYDDYQEDAGTLFFREGIIGNYVKVEIIEVEVEHTDNPYILPLAGTGELCSKKGKDVVYPIDSLNGGNINIGISTNMDLATYSMSATYLVDITSGDYAITCEPLSIEGYPLPICGTLQITAVQDIYLNYLKYSLKFNLYIGKDDEPVPPPSGSVVKRSFPSKAYELDKGDSFDGNYIPHFVELNWYFGESPVTYHGIQKLRVHGLSKGWVKLSAALAGMQTEYDSDYMQPQIIDMPKSDTHITEDYAIVTNYADYSSRGLSIQIRFDGRNKDIKKPEPSHVIQVLVTQSTPSTTGARAN